MYKFRIYFYPLLLAMVLVYFQKKLFFNTGDLTKGLAHYRMDLLVLSFVYGIIFGLISCPVCGLPLSLALGATETHLRGVILKNIMFHVSRFLIIFVYAFCGSLITSGLNLIFQNVSFFLGAIIMIIAGFNLLGKLRINFFGLCPHSSGTLKGSFYALFGFSLGFVCGFEATGFLLPLWFGNKDSTTNVFTLLIFSFSAVLPLMIMSILFFLGFRGLIHLFRARTRIFLINLSGFYLILLGLSFLVSVLRL